MYVCSFNRWSTNNFQGSNIRLSIKFADFFLTKFQFFLTYEQQNIRFCMASTTPHSHQYAVYKFFSFWMMKNNFNCYFKDIFYKRCNKYQKTAITIHFMVADIIFQILLEISCILVTLISLFLTCGNPDFVATPRKNQE